MVDNFRPKDVAELRAVLDGSRSQRPAVPLMQFFEKKQACQQTCQERVQARAQEEIGLFLEERSLAFFKSKDHKETGYDEERQAARERFLRARFERLEQQCDAACGKRFAHMLK